MKKIVLASLVLAGFASTSFAADLPSRRAPPVYVPPVLAPVFTWSGMYAGLNAGYAFDGSSYNNLAATTAAQQGAINAGNRAGFLRQRASGFTGGGQIGYNYQLGGGIPLIGQLGGVFGNGGATGGVVIGVEADAAYADLKRDTLFVGGNGNISRYHSNTDFVGTVRGRVGYAFGDLLIFGTGGFAYGDVHNAATFTGVGNYFGSTNSFRTGYAYGGGLEYAIPTTSFVNFFHSSAVTLKAEYIHYDLGTQTEILNNAAAGGAPYINRIKTNGNIVRAGINYKIDLFNAPAAPVVARY